MNKSLLLVAMLAAGSAYAGDSCDYDVDFGITLGEQVVLSRDNGANFAMQHGRLWRNGSEIKLNAEQRQWVRDYEAQTREFVPQVVEVTMEGLAIGGEATVGAFTMLLGKNHEAIPKIEKKFSELRTEVNKRMDDTHLPRKVMSLQDSDYDLIDDGASLGWSVVDAGFSVLGKALHAAFDEEYGKKWEAEMKTFEKEFEARIDARSDELEAKAKTMCATLDTMNALEQKLSASDSALSDFDVVMKRDKPCNEA